MSEVAERAREEAATGEEPGTGGEEQVEASTEVDREADKHGVEGEFEAEERRGEKEEGRQDSEEQGTQGAEEVEEGEREEEEEREEKEEEREEKEEEEEGEREEEEREMEEEREEEVREKAEGIGEESSHSSDDSSEEDDEPSREAEGGESSQGSSRWSTREERMKRLRELHRRRLEARQLNHREVVEEDRRNKLPANWESRQRKLDWEEEEEKARKEAEEAGEDYEQQKLLQTSAADLDRLQRKRKKKNPDPGFSDYAQAQYRQYERLTKQFKPDLETYEKQKMEMGEDFYPGVNTLLHGGSGKVSRAGLERMTEDLEKQIEKRAKYSRRRAFVQDNDVDYINERNMKFNKKAARYYDKYTSEIKQNLERGTAM